MSCPIKLTTYNIHYTKGLLVVSGKTGIATIFSWDIKNYTKKDRHC